MILHHREIRLKGSKNVMNDILERTGMTEDELLDTDDR
jgi:hypothetical protein